MLYGYIRAAQLSRILPGSGRTFAKRRTLPVFRLDGG